MIIIHAHFLKKIKALRIRRDLRMCRITKMAGFGVSILVLLVGSFIALERNCDLPGLLPSRDNNNTELF